MAITDEFRGSAPTFLEGFTPDMAEGGGGEALLAVALAANDAQQRKAAKALLKKAKQPRLLAALKALPRRNYQSKSDALGDDLVAMGEVEGLDVAQLAFHLHQLLYRCEHTAAFFASQVPVDYLRGLIEASMEKHGQILLNESPWPSSKLLPLLPEYPAAKSVRVWLLDEGELPCLSGLTELAGLGIRGPGSLPPGCVEGVPLRGVTFQDSRVDSLAPLVGCPLELVRYSRGPLAELPDLAAWPALRELSIEDCELKELPSSIGALSALTELTLKRCGIRTLPPELAHMPALTELNLFDLEFDHLPEFADAQPLDHVSCHGVTWPEHVSAGAGRLLELPCTARVREAFEGVVLSQFSHLPSFSKALASYAETGDDRASRLTELLLVASRLYVDDEHGPSSNRFWASVVRDQGGPLDVAANEAISDRQINSASGVKKLAAQLSSVEGFDAQAFEAFGLEAVGSGAPQSRT